MRAWGLVLKKLLNLKLKIRSSKFLIVPFLVSLFVALWCTPSQAHWADLAVAEILVGETESQVTLTFPTGLAAFADDNQDNQLSSNEVQKHQKELQSFLDQKLRLSDNQNQMGALTIKPPESANIPPHLQATVGTHSTLLLLYSWPQPLQGLKIHYDLFLPGVPTSRCLATISHLGKVQNFIFSPRNQNFSLIENSPWLLSGSLIIATLGSFAWGAMHAISPGHGKTIVGAYLAGSRATPQHALFLGLTTTLSHTTGVFAIGLLTLFASQFILTEQLYPWLSLLSGLMVVTIGTKLFISRVKGVKFLSSLPFTRNWVEHSHEHHGHSHDHPNHSHDHHDHSHNHHDHSHEHHNHSHNHHDHSHDDRDHSHEHHGHSHDHHGHSHHPIPDMAITWRSLLVLGISGGLIPCPSALVVLLSAIAVGRVGFGLWLVLVFSFGLAAVLTSLGLLLVSAKHLFNHLPTSGVAIQVLPAISSLVVTLLGSAIAIRALIQIGVSG